MGRVSKGYYFYSPQSSTVIKSKMAATTIFVYMYPGGQKLRGETSVMGSRTLSVRLKAGEIFSFANQKSYFLSVISGYNGCGHIWATNYSQDGDNYS